MSDCIFCKIIDGSIPSNKVYEDDKVVAFHDINPLAKVHILVVPKCHIESADHIDAGNSDFVKHVFEVIPGIAKDAGVTDNYQVVNNCGEKAGQTVKHLHFHILSNK
ncbi:MAG: histidine triad nucleotide-binding protein [Bacillota bacterium]|nr:histidine triad nucleotide-binding protein [Bacillota bacterium]